MIHLDQYPDRFKVLPPLAGLISMVEGSRAEILSNVWKLIKTVGAQDRDDPTKIVAVGGLEKLMEREKVMPFVLLPDMINRYLTHPDPVILTYQVT
jgi:SWI/SNF-related matrix-associated actin-dependent regulator of chromatin subfamily D